MKFVITANNPHMIGYCPPETMVEASVATKTDEQIDAELPEELTVPGAIIYTADMSVIKVKDFDGSWKAKE